MKILSWICRGYLLLILALGFQAVHYNPLLKVAVFGSIFALLGYRFWCKKPNYFLPDLILFSLPFFWGFNSLFIAQSYISELFVPQFFLFIVSLLLMGPGILARPFTSNRLHLGILLSLFFFVGFYSFLKLVYPPFELVTYRNLMVEAFFFYSTFPMARAAFAFSS